MKYLFVFIWVLNFGFLQAQDSGVNQIISDTTASYNGSTVKLGNKKMLDLTYNWYYPGKNISLQYVHYFGRHALTGGVKYHLNGQDRFKDYAFKEKFYASSALEHVGLSIGYQFDFKRPSATQIPAVNPFLFTSIQYGYLGIRHTYQTANPNAPNILQYETEYSNDFSLFEYTLGAGITAKLYKRWHLNGGAGFSIAAFKPSFIPSGNSVIYDTEFLSETGFVYRIGMSYLLK